MHRLTEAYKKGLIVYPRTESDYIQSGELFSYEAHPKLPVLNPYLEPLKEMQYPLTDASLMLHLHNRRILTPSNYKKTEEKIKKFHSLGEKKLFELRDSYYDFLSKIHQKEPDYFLKNLMEHYEADRPEPTPLNKFENISECFLYKRKQENKIEKGVFNGERTLSGV